MFVFNGKHFMADVVVKDKKSLVSPITGENLIEEIVEKIDMTMILPPITVKFPHAQSELKRILAKLKCENLDDSQTYKDIENNLRERKNEAYGYSTFAMIAESHLSIHTFPEFNYFSFDCYSCKNFDEELVTKIINHNFDVEKIVINVVARSVPE